MVSSRDEPVPALTGRRLSQIPERWMMGDDGFLLGHHHHYHYRASLYRINVFILLVSFLTTKLHLIIILQEVREWAGAIPAFFPVWGVCVCMMRHLLTSSSSKPPLPPRVNVDSIYSRSGYRYWLDSISCMIFFFFFLFLFFFLPPRHCTD